MISDGHEKRLVKDNPRRVQLMEHEILTMVFPLGFVGNSALRDFVWFILFLKMFLIIAESSLFTREYLCIIRLKVKLTFNIVGCRRYREPTCEQRFEEIYK